MQKLKILIEENAFGDVRPVEVVADVPIARLVPALVEELHLPQTDLFGKKLTYKLRYGSGGFVLSEQATLEACGVEPGARLALDSHVVDEMLSNRTEQDSLVVPAIATQFAPSADPTFYSSLTMADPAVLPALRKQANVATPLPDTIAASASLAVPAPPLNKQRFLTRRAFLIAGAAVVGISGVGLGYAGYAGYAAYRKLAGAAATSQPARPVVTTQPITPTPAKPMLPATAKSVFTFTRHQREVHVVQWSPDGTLLASGADDAQVFTWSTDGAIHQTIRHPAPVHAMAWSPDGQRLVTGAGNQILFLNAMTGATLVRFRHRHTATINSLAWTSHNQQQVVSGAADMRAIVWNTTNISAQGTFTRHNSAIEAVTWAADGQTIASSSLGGAVRVWMAADGQEIHGAYQTDQVSMRAAAFAPSGTQLAVGGDDGVVRLWNGLNCQQQDQRDDTTLCMDMPTQLQASQKPVRALAWSPDARFLAAGTDDGMITVWYPAQGTKALFTLQQNASVRGIAWAPNGNQLATAAGNSVTLWNVT